MPCQTPPKAPRRLAQLLFTDLIEGLQKMLDHVKLVIDDLSLRALGKKAVSKGFPHVDDPMGDASEHDPSQTTSRTSPDAFLFGLPQRTEALVLWGPSRALTRCQ